MDRDKAKAELSSFLANLLSPGIPLTSRQITDYGHKGAVAGWRLEIEFPDRKRRIDFLIDQGFPYSPPVVVLVDRPPALQWPHIVWPHLESDGKLCLTTSSTRISYHTPVEVAKNFLHSACQLIEDCVSGINQDDFISEFDSYWKLIALTPGSVEFRSLVVPEPPSRIIQVSCGQGFYLLSENGPTGLQWLQNFFQDNKEKERKSEPAVFLWLDRVLLPVDYPRSALDVLRLARQRTGGGAAFLESLAEKEPEEVVVLFGASSKNGPCLAGVTIRRPQLSNSRSADPLHRGFRPGRVPARTLAMRYLSALPIMHSIVSRVDASWVHGRDNDRRQSVLQKSKIAVLGCGSVGGAVARKLAQAGVGQMLLVDPETLSWSNVGRHSLGASWVYKPKARSLADQIRKDFPHITSVDAQERTWQDLVRSDPALLKSCNLIVSAIGSGNAEDELNQWHLENGRRPPIVYIWTEAHACAGHAVAIMPGGGCFQCGQTEPDKSMFRVTQWPEGDDPRQEPACGAVYQPYGPAELTYIEALITEMVLDCLLQTVTSPRHRLWIGRESLLKSAGGLWNPAWASSTKGPLTGGFIEERPWLANSACRDCKGHE